MKGLHMVAWVLVIIGALNWGLEAFGWGVGQWLGSSISMLVYVLIGLAGLYELFTHKSNCKMCGGDKGMAKPMGTM